jgi:hypothetical protein
MKIIFFEKTVEPVFNVVIPCLIGFSGMNRKARTKGILNENAE